MLIIFCSSANSQAANIYSLQVRNSDGDMVPLRTLLKTGPLSVPMLYAVVQGIREKLKGTPAVANAVAQQGVNE